MTTATRFFWAAGASVRRAGGQCMVAGTAFPISMAESLEQVADSTINGATVEDLETACSDATGRVRLLTAALVQRGILVEGPVGLKQLAYDQSRPIGDRLLAEEDVLDAQRSADFRREQAMRRPVPGTTVPLADATLPEWLARRRSVREFSPEAVSAEQLGKLMAPLRHRSAADLPEGRRAWPSTGGLYAIDCFLHIKPGRAESVPAGIYAYDPVAHGLVLRGDHRDWGESFHYLTNRQIHRSSAMSFLLVADLGVIMPKYRDMGYPLALLDAGVLAAVISLAACEASLGSCCIGDLDFEHTRNALRLGNSQQVVHVIEIGPLKMNGTNDER